METPFEKPPIESQEGKTIPISADSLRNPTVSMDRNKSGEYATYIDEAQDLLRNIQEAGFWSSQQAEDYASKYKELNNALEVMRSNSLLKAIFEDKDQVMWDYPPEAADLIGDIASLESTEQLNESINGLIGNVPDLGIGVERVYEGFYRLNITKTVETGSTYSFSINIDSKNKKLTFLAFQPISELCVGFSEEAESNEFIRKLFELNPRTNIQIPEQVRQRVMEREQRLQQAENNELFLQEGYDPHELRGWVTTCFITIRYIEYNL